MIGDIKFDVTRSFTSLFGETSDVQAPTLGTLYFDGLGRGYRFVQSNFGTAFNAGDLAFLEFTANCPFEVNQLGSGSTDVRRLTGVVTSTQIPASSGAGTAYGWIQFEGQGLASLNGGTAIAIGDFIKGTTGQSYGIKDAAYTAGATYPNWLVARSAYAVNAAALISVEIACRGF